jgi:hypothetical protein
VNEDVRRYEAVVWEKEPESVGKRTFIYATDLRDAKRRLEEVHGDDKIYSIWNEEDSNKPR